MLGLLVLSACGAASEAPTEDSASLEAVLSIERVEDASRDEDSLSASAMAQFVILPSEADVHDTLGAAGLRSQLPERAGCAEVVEAERAGSEAAGLEGRRYEALQPLELLEAGDVSVQADDRVTRLALNLFPPSGSASGVIYTTPDQSAAPLPPDANYSIRATGSGVIPPLTIEGQAPRALADVTVGGLPLERALQLTAGQPLDFTWAEGSPGDRVYLELADAERSLACVFADEEGSGSLPGSLTAHFSSGSVVRLSVHRVREAMQPDESIRLDTRGTEGFEISSLETTVRFDFEITSALRVD
ncbi:MAG TPA: hypothetical protein VJU61_00200 [Polyangiaceae bacterium]|nr:hypothetical protein [Polyangiaceae bacterium]